MKESINGAFIFNKPQVVVSVVNFENLNGDMCRVRYQWIVVLNKTTLKENILPNFLIFFKKSLVLF